MQKIENIIIVRSKTRLEQLTERFNTVEQAKFYVTQQKKSFDFKRSASKISKRKRNAPHEYDASFSPYEIEHRNFYDAFNLLQKEVKKKQKFKIIDQDFLPSYIFTEKDLVIVIGQDGLVANTAKYVHGIPIIAINPDPNRYDGILLPFSTTNFMQAVNNVLNGTYNYKMVTMAETELNDGQRLLAFNDFFIGPLSHTSARYEITFNENSEKQSSSGIIVSTGAGSTGWLSSLFNMANSINTNFHRLAKHPALSIPMDAEQLVFVVREPFLSKTSQIQITCGILYPGEELIVESNMPQNGIIFSDGIQSDFLQFNSGSIATIRIAEQKAKLVLP